MDDAKPVSLTPVVTPLLPRKRALSKKAPSRAYTAISLVFSLEEHVFFQSVKNVNDGNPVFACDNDLESNHPFNQTDYNYLDGKRKYEPPGRQAEQNISSFCSISKPTTVKKGLLTVAGYQTKRKEMTYTEMEEKIILVIATIKIGSGRGDYFLHEWRQFRAGSPLAGMHACMHT